MNKHNIITYLSFNGDCEEAVNAYINAFGGKISYLSRWDENNSEKENQNGKIMHIRFTLGTTSMAAGDDFEAETSNSMAKLMIDMETEEEALKSIEILRKDGKVISGLSPHPEPDDAGVGCVITDKYGVTWIITCPNSGKRDN